MRYRPLQEQVVVVVGAASGIGRETALQLGQKGAKLVVADNDEEGLRTLVDEVRSSGSTITDVVADVADVEQVSQIGKKAIDEYGRIDTWAHVAAVAVSATFLDTSLDEFRRVVDVDFMGQVHGAKVALSHMLQTGGGNLIHVSSIEARRSLPYHSAYAASKHAIDGFVEALRVELRHANLPVGVTQILPASIDTPIFDKSLSKLGVKPMGIPPFYQPSSVAMAIVYACEHDTREILVGGAGKGILSLQRLSPSLLDAILNAVGFRLQRTTEPRSEDGPNNLRGPIGVDNQAHGGFGKLTFRHSVGTWLQLHPWVKRTTMIGAVGLLGSGIVRRVKASSNKAGV